MKVLEIGSLHYAFKMESISQRALQACIGRPWLSPFLTPFLLRPSLLGLGSLLLLLESLAVPQSRFLALHILYKNPRYPVLLSPLSYKYGDTGGWLSHPGHTARDWTQRAPCSEMWLSHVESPAKAVAVTLKSPWLQNCLQLPSCGNSYGFAHGIRVCAQHFLGQLWKNLRGLTFRPLCINHKQGHVIQ